jgi:hypothetical protein
MVAYFAGMSHLKRYAKVHDSNPTPPSMKYECQPLYDDGPHLLLQEVNDLGTECIVSKFITWRESGITALGNIFLFEKSAG